MGKGQQKLISTLSFAAVAVMLAGCGHGTVASHDTIKPVSPAHSASAPLTLAPDIRACAGVQALIGHITVGTARWSPSLAPFDKGVSSQIRLLSVDLEKQAPQAQTPRIQAVVRSNGRAFRAVADAMAGKNQKNVVKAINATRITYRDLRKVCRLKATGSQ